MSTEGKYALITGGSSGIGYELAKLFAKDGYNLIVVSRNQEHLDRVQSELEQQFKIEVQSISKDLSLKESPLEIYNEVKTKGIDVDVLVNDAGQGVFGEFIDTDIDRELEIIQLNIGAYVVLTKCFLKDMVARGAGKILNVGSIAGEMPGPWQSVYHGTKAFINSWSEAIRSEVKDKGVTVTVLLPGATDTDFFSKADMENSKIVQESKLSDPAKVAQDGFDALMSGDDKIVSGLKNKVQVAIGNFMPDSKVADNMQKQQGPVDE
jgi:short-subunit dehydrogenase